MNTPGYKEIAIISAAIILILVLLLYPAPKEQTEDDMGSEDQNKSTEENQTQDGSAATEWQEDYEEAVLSGDAGPCSSIGDASERDACIAKASDTRLYLEAVEARDPSLCANISDTNVRETCEYALTYGINVTLNIQ
jgi:hypothetical protein